MQCAVAYCVLHNLIDPFSTNALLMDKPGSWFLLKMSLFRRCFSNILLLKTNCLVSTLVGHWSKSKPELRFCATSNPDPGVSEICDSECLWQLSRLDIRLHVSSVNHFSKVIYHHYHYNHHHYHYHHHLQDYHHHENDFTVNLFSLSQVAKISAYL